MGLHLSDSLLFLGFPLSSGYSCAQLCPFVLRARKITSICFDYFSLNHHIKLRLIISHKNGKFTACNFLLQSPATHLASARLVFHPSESSDYFYFFFMGLSRVYSYNLREGWCDRYIEFAGPHWKRHSKNYLYFWMDMTSGPREGACLLG